MADLVLVRLMRCWSILHLSLLGLPFAVCCCAPYYPFPHRRGDYAHKLHFGDINKIRALVRNRTDIRQPICDIEVHAPGEARVSSGPDCHEGGVHFMTCFMIRKRDGEWTVDESSIEDCESIVLIHPISTD